MAKRILITTISVLLGIVAGMVVMMALHFASMLVYPLPDNIDFMSQDPANQEQLKAWFGTLPAGAFVLAAASHGLGCMAGAVVAMVLSGRRSLLPPGIVGVFFTIGGIMNLSSIPHPTWFPFVDVPIYLVLALLAGYMLLRRGDPKESNP